MSGLKKELYTAYMLVTLQSPPVSSALQVPISPWGFRIHFSLDSFLSEFKRKETISPPPHAGLCKPCPLAKSPPPGAINTARRRLRNEA